MTEREQSGAAGGDEGVAAAPAAGREPTAPRPSVWGGQRSRGRPEDGSSPAEGALDPQAPPGAMRPGAMSAAVLRAREAARHEWLRSIPEDPNERQRVADDLRP